MPDDLEVTYRETPLFPEYKPNPFEALKQDEQTMLDSWKIFVEEIKDLPYYIDVPVPKPDIVRYSDRFARQSKSVKKALANVPTDLQFFPDELHGVKDPAKSRTGTKLATRNFDLKRLDALGKDGDDKASDDDEEEEDLVVYDDEEEEEENDYLVDHWDDEADGVGDDAASDRED
ncbi:hypothetical protein HKX48_008872 [Thoreauomyces humboldtii]|nr:hypothetical protein HKX48_008872 [Thoreauomyces humboldtii]